MVKNLKLGRFFMSLRCAFLSTDNLEDFFVYDDLVKPHLSKLGWQVDDVSWHDQTVNYDDFDLVVVRSTWDYQSHYQAFIDCLKRIQQANCELQNSFELMRWNVSKTYLKSLYQKGVRILPTVWAENYSKDIIEDAFTTLNCDELVVKPVVSANADDTYRVTRSALDALETTLANTFANKAFMIQKFETSITTLGETSLFYFDSAFSHGITKKPAEGDFRVQEEHGGQLFALSPSKEMLAFGQTVIDALPEKSLYARIDIIQTAEGPALIEVELIEPSLYFNMDEQSAERFAKAIHRRFA
jgi:glutathione synthase/RimK-type ligase-like ATP-grasp enzyme